MMSWSFDGTVIPGGLRAFGGAAEPVTLDRLSAVQCVRDPAFVVVIASPDPGTVALASWSTVLKYALPVLAVVLLVVQWRKPA